jgi:hypothetical protein
MLFGIGRGRRASRLTPLAPRTSPPRPPELRPLSIKGTVPSVGAALGAPAASENRAIIHTLSSPAVQPGLQTLTGNRNHCRAQSAWVRAQPRPGDPRALSNRGTGPARVATVGDGRNLPPWQRAAAISCGCRQTERVGALAARTRARRNHSPRHASPNQRLAATPPSTIPKHINQNDIIGNPCVVW